MKILFKLFLYIKLILLILLIFVIFNVNKKHLNLNSKLSCMQILNKSLAYFLSYKYHQNAKFVKVLATHFFT